MALSCNPNDDIQISELVNEINKKVEAQDVYFKYEFINKSTGNQDSGKPIILDERGLIDTTMINPESSLTYQGGFTPTSGAEYPTGDMNTGDFWTIEGLSGDYTFTSGDLTGQSTSNGDYMINGEDAWALVDTSMDFSDYYKLDGSTPLEADMNAGGFKITNASDGSADTDLITLSQLSAHTTNTNNPHNVTTSQINAEPSLGLGTAGQVLATNQSENGKEWVDMTANGGGNFKNKIVNATFNVWQEYPSRSVVVSGNTVEYCADLFGLVLTNGQFTVTEGELNGSRSLKSTIDTPPTDLESGGYIVPFRYIFEGQDLYYIAKNSGNITISFKFRTNVIGTYNVVLHNKFEDDSYIAEFNVSTADVVETYSVTIPLNATWSSPLGNDNNVGFVLDICSLGLPTSLIDQWESGNFMSSTNAVNWADTAGNYIEIAEPQLEEGDTATEFERPNITDELLRVQRYFYRYDGNGIGYYGSLHKASTEWRHIVYKFPTTMRTVPTVYDIITDPQRTPANIDTTKEFVDINEDGFASSDSFSLLSMNVNARL